MAAIIENKDKIPTWSQIKLIYDLIMSKTIPEYSSADNGKVLSIVDGQPAWVEPSTIGMEIDDRPV